jgi:plasmid stability protein
MANLTLTIDDDLLRRARIRALEQHTSVNALVRDFLERFADASAQEQATEAILAIAERSTASSGPDGRSWTRDDIYEERLGRYGR